MKVKIPNLVSVLILTLITVVAWVGFGIYRAVTQKPSPVVDENIVKDLDPTLNKSIIDKMKSRLFLTEEQIPTTQIEVGTNQSPTPLPLSTSTPEATVSESPSATPSQTPTNSASPTPQT